MEYNNVLASLSKEQHAAAEYIKGHSYIVAGAGSGKTRTLTSKIAYLIQNRIARPQNITAITFTNFAAKTMKDRLAKMVGNSMQGLHCSTIHSLCFSIIRKNFNIFNKLYGIENNFTIIDPTDQQSDLCIARDELIKTKLEGARDYYELGIIKEAAAALTRLKPRELVSRVATVLNSEVDETLKMEMNIDGLRELNDLYRNMLRTENKIDFDEMQVWVVKALREDPLLLEKLHSEIKWLFVDEYQDINGVQSALIQELVGPDTILTIVGDPDQSIYGFRHAEIKYINHFEKYYPYSKKLMLEENYRSTKNIIGASNILIEHNVNRIKKVLYTNNDEGHKVEVRISWDEATQDKHVIEEIINLHNNKNYAYSDIAILYRTHAQSALIERELQKQGIRYVIKGGIKFFDRAEVKDVLAFLTFIINPKDKDALERSTKIIEGVGIASSKRFANWIKENKIKITDPIVFWQKVMHEANTIKKMSNKAINGLRTFAKHACKLLLLFKNKCNLLDVADYVLYTLSYRDYLRKISNNENDMEYNERVENVKSLFVLFPDEDLATSLLELKLSAIEGEEESEDALNLMTIHASKGLEFKVVFIIGCVEDKLPFYYATVPSTYDDPPDDIEKEIEKKIEEERRLCYVAMTRAEELLFMTAYMKTEKEKCTLSRFIKEIEDSENVKIYVDSGTEDSKMKLKRIKGTDDPILVEYYDEIEKEKEYLNVYYNERYPY